MPLFKPTFRLESFIKAVGENIDAGVCACCGGQLVPLADEETAFQAGRKGEIPYSTTPVNRCGIENGVFRE